MTDNSLLNIVRLNVGFDGLQGYRHILKDINLDVVSNEILAVVGESGSGKSVMSKTIMGLLQSNARTQGNIYLHHSQQVKKDEPLDLLHLNRHQAQKIRGDEISMIFQDPMTSLNPLMSVGKQIAEAIRIHQHKSVKESLLEAGRMLDLVRVPAGKQVMNCYPYELSGGMRQRVMIAIALACRPKLLIADEPTTALDVTIQAQILALIKSLQSELNMGVIFITHDMGVVFEIADRVAVMYKGNIVETGTRAHIFNESQHPYTQALLKAVPRLGAMKGRDLPYAFPVLNMEATLADPDKVILEEVGNQPDYTASALLTVKDLCVIFPRQHNIWGKVMTQTHATNHVSLELWPGETLGIVGESGSGKSTIGNAILGLNKDYASGEIYYRDEVSGKQIDLMHLPHSEYHHIKHAIGFIFQDPLASLNPRMTIGECVEEPFIIHYPEMSSEEREKRSKTLLEKVGIDTKLYRHYPHEFSGGMLQRVNIARALTTNPKIIVADEAVSALDVSVQATVLNLMLALQKELKIAFIFISHDMAVIERVCHRVAVLTKGQLVEQGGRRELFENPQHSYTKKLLAAVPTISHDIRQKHHFTLSDEEISDPVYPIGEQPKPLKLKQYTTTHFYAQEDE